jgi:microcin C transport system permease protein
MYGFDKPAHERFFQLVVNYLQFDLGESYYRDISVVDLVLEKMPVSISLGLWSTLIIYLISIPLGIKKAVKDGEAFDIWSSAAVFIGYAIPSFMFAILLIILFAGGRYWDLFPLRGLLSDELRGVPWWNPRVIIDYLWHMTLPIIAMVISGFAGLTMLTKNSFLDEINKQYVLTARAKGLTEKRVLYGHIFRNAMLIVIAGFPSAFLSIFFTGSLLIEVIFSLDGLGLLGYESIINRDYPVVLGTLYFFALIGLVMTLIRDLVYVWIDPRIDFEARRV